MAFVMLLYLINAQRVQQIYFDRFRTGKLFFFKFVDMWASVRSCDDT